LEVVVTPRTRPEAEPSLDLLLEGGPDGRNINEGPKRRMNTQCPDCGLVFEARGHIHFRPEGEAEEAEDLASLWE